MRIQVIPSILLLTVVLSACQGLPKNASEYEDGRDSQDWLIYPTPYRSKFEKDTASKTVRLTNGLIERTFKLSPNAATVGYRQLISEEECLRAVRPEALVVLNGRAYEVGGLQGQPEQAYLLPEWLDEMSSDPGAFQFESFRTGPIEETIPWTRKRSSENRPWPPPGISLSLKFVPPGGSLEGIVIQVIYELYDGIPLLAKKIEISNSGLSPVILDSFTSEILAAVESESSVNSPPNWEPPVIHLESDYAFLADNPKSAAKTIFRLSDPLYTSQVNYRLQTPCLIVSHPPIGPRQRIPPGGRFETFKTYELVFDSTDRERRGLSLRKMYRTIAPWVTENPILMHLTSTEPRVVREAVDQCAEAGFEMLILSFGSGLDMENEDPRNISKFKELADYAHSRGVEIGGYSLLASRRIDDATDVIDPDTGKPGGAAFGNSPCLESRWGQEYFKKIKKFFVETDFDLLEHDGSYPGDICGSSEHPGHFGVEDSQWTQWRRITDFYKWCREKGIYLNVPDWYFLSGSNKCAMGYREVNWSLPRERQIILGRQNIFDGTWQKTPTMGWMFVPLVEYQGGGKAATLEPLSQHLEFYEAHLAQNFLSGVQACYRGARLYDTEKTLRIVRKWVNLYKQYRDILESDIIHVRRPDGRDLDGILHVNPDLEIKGLAVIYNPTDRKIVRDWNLPLYYTGIQRKARIREKGGRPTEYPLDRNHRIRIPVRLPPKSVTWFLID